MEQGPTGPRHKGRERSPEWRNVPGTPWQKPLKAAPEGTTPHLPQSLRPPDTLLKSRALSMIY